MGYPIFHSQYTAAQIEASIGKTPRIKSSTRTWEIWDIATSAYVDTGVSIDTQLYVDSTLTESGYAADAKVTGNKLGELKSDFEDGLGLVDEYLNDIVNIDITFSAYNKESASVTVESGKKVNESTGAITTNSNHSLMYMTVPADGFFYCTATPTDSSYGVYSATPLGTGTALKYGWKTGFPTQSNPLRVKAGQIVAVSAKSTSTPQIIYLATDGTASLKQQTNIDKLLNGCETLNKISGWVIGRWGSDGATHTSSTVARTKSTVTVTEDTEIIADIGYFMDILESSTFYEKLASYKLEVGKSYKINITTYAGSTLADATATAAHVKVFNVITSEYERLKDSFYGLDMYNRLGICGDSYAMKRSTYNNCWGQIIGQRLGISVDLYGHSGYTTKAFIDGTGETNSLTGLLAGTACNLYWLAFGINDASRILSDQTYSVGSESDLSGSYSNYPDTFWGNYGRIIESIQNTFASAKIVIAKVIYKNFYTTQANTGSTNIPPINEVIEGLAEHYSIPCIDFADDVFYRSSDFADNMQEPVYTHPDPILFPGMASANMRLFSKAVEKNPSYFKTSASG